MHIPNTEQPLRRKEGVQDAVERVLGCGTEEGKGPLPPGPLGLSAVATCSAQSRDTEFSQAGAQPLPEV